MNTPSRTQLLLLTSLSLASAHCSSDDDGADACQPPNIVGVAFGPTGTATVKGTGTLPAGIPDGLDLQLLAGTDGFSGSVASDNLFQTWRTCGRSVRYEITELPSGTFVLQFEVSDHDSDELEPLFTGRATETFPLADGETKQFDATFQ